MSILTRTYSFSDGTTAYGSQVDAEIANIVNTINSLDQGNTTWTNVKVTTLLPQADVNAGGHKITNLGTPTTSGDAAIYPITNAQITAQTIRGSTANSGGSAQEISQGTISTVDLRANAITQIQSSSSAGVTSTGGGDSLVTTASITTTGGNVLILAMACGIGPNSSTATILVVRNGPTAIAGNYASHYSFSPGTFIQLNLTCVDSPSAGSYTYSLYTNPSMSSGTYSLVAIEIKK